MYTQCTPSIQPKATQFYCGILGSSEERLLHNKSYCKPTKSALQQVWWAAEALEHCWHPANRISISINSPLTELTQQRLAADHLFLDAQPLLIKNRQKQKHSNYPTDWFKHHACRAMLSSTIQGLGRTLMTAMNKHFNSKHVARIKNAGRLQ